MMNRQYMNLERKENEKETRLGKKDKPRDMFGENSNLPVEGKNEG